MLVGLERFDLRIPGCGSLKEKRHVVKGLGVQRGGGGGEGRGGTRPPLGPGGRGVRAAGGTRTSIKGRRDAEWEGAGGPVQSGRTEESAGGPQDHAQPTDQGG